MTRSAIGGNRKINRISRARGRAAEDGSQSRHRLGVLAAVGAVGVGTLALAGAVSGTFWPNSGLDHAQAARQDEARPMTDSGLKTAAIPQVETPSPTSSTASDEPGKTATATKAPSTQTAHVAVPAAAAPKAETRVADGKSAALSPDERIERAMDRITSGANDSTIRKAITVAALEKKQETSDVADTPVTDALPDSSAYAPSQESMSRSEDDGALGAIRDVDRSSEPTSPSQPEAAKEEAPADDAAPHVSASAKPTGPLSAARVSSAVHLRAQMDNRSAVVTTVPANAAVKASSNCASWCEVVYDGRHGYIYKSFIRRQAAAMAAPARDATKTASNDAAKPAADESKSTPAAASPGGILVQTGSAEALREAAQRAQRSR